MYINLRYGENEALMNFIEQDDKYWLLCEKDANKVTIIKENNNETIMIKDGEELNIVVEWVEDAAKVQTMWDKFDEVGANYFASATNLFGIIATVK